MKITPKQYAMSLYESVQGKSAKDGGVVVANFFQVLVKNNQTGKLNKIMDQFTKIWNKEKGIVEAKIVSSKKLDNEAMKLLDGYIKKLSGAKEVNVTGEIDEKILGGVVVRFGDQIIDSSLKTKIEDLKEQMVK